MEPISIVVIDESITVRKILEVTFDREGCRVRAYGSPVDALRALYAEQDDHQHVDVVIMDLSLPVINGFDVILYIRKKSPLLPIVVLTSEKHSTFLRHLYAKLAGANAYALKPFKTNAIVALVEAVLPKREQA